MQRSFPQVALINDTSLFSSHFGCQLVGHTFREQFKRVGLDLVLSLPKKFNLEVHRARLQTVDLVVINGEGTFHHNKYNDILAMAANYPAVLVNCVYQDNEPNKNLRDLLYCTARESMSAAELSREGVACEIVPDVIFDATVAKAFPRRAPEHQIGITDNVVKEYRGIWPFRWQAKGLPAFGLAPGTYIEKLTSYERLAVGRFHAAVLCALFNIPFSTWDSNTWKTRALMKDMGIGHLHFDSRKEACANVPKALPDCVSTYVRDARIKIERMFDRIHQIAVEQQR